MSCSSLTSVIIGNSVTVFGSYAFDDCPNLTSMTFRGSTPPRLVYPVFTKVNKSVSVYVPANSREAYKNALKGYGMSNIKALPLSLNGSESYTQNSQIDDIDVSFTRNFSTNWEAIYLPFSLKYEDWKDDFEVARINAVRQYDTDDDGNIDRTELEFVKMKSGSIIYPNTPYLIRAKEISIRVVGEETTGIDNIQHPSPNTQIYDLNGRKVNENNLKPGMYVKNGRKVVVR